MAIRKNVKRIDPRYFMDEKTEHLNESIAGTRPTKPEYSHVSGKGHADAPSGMKPQPKTYAINNNVIAIVYENGEIENYTGSDPQGVLDLLKRLGYASANFPVAGPA